MSSVRFALLALAIGTFAIGTNEFVMMGLLPDVARDVGVSIPTAGGLISAYALGVVIGAPLLTIAAVRLPRKAALVVFMSWFVVGNILSAVAPGFGLLFAARLFTGLPHGAFVGAGSVVAASLAEPARRARAIAKMALGMTVANIVGVPAATLLGQWIGWRFTFGAVALIGVITVLGVLLTVPHLERRTGGVRLRAEFAAFRNRQVWLSLAICVIGFAGVFASFSYVTPMMVQVAGYRPADVTFLLALFGLGMTTGNMVGARCADRNHKVTLHAGLVVLGAVLFAFVFTAHSTIGAAITVFLLGAAAFVVGTSLQMRVMAQAPAAPTLVLAAMQSVFNTANSLGAYLGGLVIAAGFGYAAPNWVGALLAGAGLTLAVVAGRLRDRPSATVTEQQAFVPA